MRGAPNAVCTTALARSRGRRPAEDHAARPSRRRPVGELHARRPARRSGGGRDRARGCRGAARCRRPSRARRDCRSSGVSKTKQRERPRVRRRTHVSTTFADASPTASATSSTRSADRPDGLGGGDGRLRITTRVRSAHPGRVPPSRRCVRFLGHVRAPPARSAHAAGTLPAAERIRSGWSGHARSTSA